MRTLRYYINLTLDGCCDHRAFVPAEHLHRYATGKVAEADALLINRLEFGSGAVRCDMGPEDSHWAG
jgi:hypothetical protein